MILKKLFISIILIVFNLIIWAAPGMNSEWGVLTLASQFGHSDKVNSVAFDPTGRFLASGSDDGTIKLWQLEQKQLLNTFTGHTAPVTSIAFSPDKNKPYLVSGSLDKTIKVWDLSDKSLEVCLTGHLGAVTSVAFHPDGYCFASGSKDGLVKIWGIDDQKLWFTLKGHKDPVNTVSFSPDGRFLASGGDDKLIKIWEWKQEHLSFYQEYDHNWRIEYLDFTPDCTDLVFLDNNGDIGFYNLKEKKFLTKKYKTKHHFTFNPQGNSIIFIDEAGILISNLEMKTIHPFVENTKNVTSIAYNYKGTLLALGRSDGSVILRDIKKKVHLHTFNAHKSSLQYSISNLKNSQTWLTIGDYSLLFDFKKEEITTKSIPSIPSETFRLLATSPDGKYKFVYNSEREKIQVLRFNSADSTWSSIIRFPGSEDEYNSIIKFSQDNQYLAVSYNDNTISVFDLHQKDRKYRFNYKTNHFLFSSDNKYFFIIKGNLIYRYDIETFKQIKTCKMEIDNIQGMAVHPHNRLIAVYNKRMIAYGDIEKEQLSTFIPRKIQQIEQVLFNEEGSWLIIRTDNQIYFYNLHERKIQKTMDLGPGMDFNILYSEKNTYLLGRDQGFTFSKITGEGSIESIKMLLRSESGDIWVKHQDSLFPLPVSGDHALAIYTLLDDQDKISRGESFVSNPVIFREMSILPLNMDIKKLLSREDPNTAPPKLKVNVNIFPERNIAADKPFLLTLTISNKEGKGHLSRVHGILECKTNPLLNGLKFPFGRVDAGATISCCRLIQFERTKKTGEIPLHFKIFQEITDNNGTISPVEFPNDFKVILIIDQAEKLFEDQQNNLTFKYELNDDPDQPGSDKITGNGNGKLEKLEGFDIVAILHNEGEYPLYNLEVLVSGDLTNHLPDFDFHKNITVLMPGQREEKYFNAWIPPAFDNSRLNLTLRVRSSRHNINRKLLIYQLINKPIKLPDHFLNKYVTVKNGTPVYGRPESSSKIIYELKDPAVVKVIEQIKGWYRIKIEKLQDEGWIKKSAIRSEDPRNNKQVMVIQHIDIYKDKKPVIYRIFPENTPCEIFQERLILKFLVIDQDDISDISIRYGDLTWSINSPSKYFKYNSVYNNNNIVACSFQTPSLKEGENIFSIRAQDKHGNESIRQMKIVYKKEKQQIYAVIIGIKEYENIPASGSKYAEKDIVKFHTFLTDNLNVPETNIYRLIDSDATLSAIYNYLTDIVPVATEQKDVLIIYYTGEGLKEELSSGETKYYMATYDTDPEKKVSTAIDIISDLPKILKHFDAGEIIFILDNCYSGAIKENDFLIKENWEFLAACRKDELSAANAEINGSVFTHFLLEGLRGAADKNSDGRVSIQEAEEYTRDKVNEYTNNKQNPVTKGDLDVSFPYELNNHEE